MLKMKEIFKKNNGFGIVEAIIALAILAIAVAALMQTTSVMFDSLSTDNRITRDNTFCENVFNDIGLIYDDTFDTYENAIVNTSTSDPLKLILSVDGVEISDENYTNFDNGILSIPSISNNLVVHTATENGTQYDLVIKNQFLDSSQSSGLSGNAIYILDTDETFFDYNETFNTDNRDEKLITNREEYSGVLVNDANTSYRAVQENFFTGAFSWLTYKYCNSSYEPTWDVRLNQLLVHFDELGNYPNKSCIDKSPMLNGFIIDDNPVGVMAASCDRVCLATSNCTSDQEIACVDDGFTSPDPATTGDLYYLFSLSNPISLIDNGDPISFTYLESTELEGFRDVKTYEDEFPDDGSDLIKLDDEYQSDLESDLTVPFLEYVDSWRTLANEKLRHNDIDIVISCEEDNDEDGICDTISRVASCQINNTDGAHMKFSRVYRKAL